MENSEFIKIEKKWQEKWEESKIFESEESNEKNKFYVLEMFPYPSASGLHMGHALNYSIGDVYARFKRMQGFNVLYPMGFDALGLPAENAAIKAGEHPKPYTENAIKNYTRQLKEIGISYDWSKTLSTMNPEYYKWNQYFFIKFLEKGLAYRKKAPVNWCPECKTVLANEQVHNGKCWRHENTEVEIKHLEQWFIKTTEYADELYELIDSLDWPDRIKAMQKNWIGKSHGVEINFEINNEKWPIFTTRPDTIHGVTFMVISAQHSRLMELVTEEQKTKIEEFLKKIKTVSQKSMKEIEELDKEGVFTGSYATNPLTKEKIPIYAGNFVIADYGSGMVMAVPAHDLRDYEFAKKYNIPITRVIAKESPARSILVGCEEIKDSELESLGIKIKSSEKERKIEIPEEKIIEYEELITKKIKPGFWNEHVGKKIVFIFKHKNNEIERIELNKESEKRIDKLASEFMENENWNKKGVWSWLSEEEFYKPQIIHTEEGIIENSKELNGKKNFESLSEIISILEKKNIGKKTINFKLRDWLVSRQRYWGTPIPVVYCKKCGIVPVPENQLPIILPEDVKFGEGNPLSTNKDFLEIKCPKCNEPARRETDTMDTFFDSSWYYLRYCDNNNDEKPFKKSKIDYWTPIDQYIGGAEHACMHLIYARFFTKALRDLGLIEIDEPFKKLFNQGMLHGEDKEKMSKSKGNIINPDEVSAKYGMDTARFFLLSLASPEKDRNWDEKGIQGSFKFMKKIYKYFNEHSPNESSKKIQSKLNKTIKEVTTEIENFNYNIAIIKIRQLFETIENEKEISNEDLGKFLKIISPFCPHIAEELWEKTGNKGFISLEKWPEADESKINEQFDEEEKLMEKAISDLSGLIKMMKEKQNKEIEKIYIYTIPNEFNYYNSEEIQKKFNKQTSIYPTNSKDKYDPQGKASKAKPGRPAIYLE